jgi:hypothetical protein
VDSLIDILISYFTDHQRDEVWAAGPFELAAELFGRMLEDELPNEIHIPIMILEKYSSSEFSFLNGNLDRLINFIVVVGPNLDMVPARSVRLRKLLYNL